MNPRISLSLAILLCLVSFTGVAWGEPDDNVETILATAALKAPAGGPPFELVKEQRSDGIYLTVRNPAGTIVASSDNLGEVGKLFMLDGKPVELAVRDLNGDGREEVAATAFYGPNSSGLFVFSWNPASSALEAIPTRYDDGKEHPEFMCSDVFLEDGSDITLSTDGNARLLGRSLGTGNSPRQAWYCFALKDGAFVFLKKDPIPDPK